MRVSSRQRLAVLALAALSACPINPSIDPTNRSCTPGDPNDLCPTGFDCYQLGCIPACTAAQQACDPMGFLSTDVLSAPQCHCPSDCACGQACVADPYWVALGYPTVCEDVCDAGTYADCPDVDTACVGSACIVNSCGAILLYGPCNSGGNNDGTCLPLGNNGSPVCQQGALNNPNDVCTPGETRAHINALCPVESYCQDGGACYATCTPNSGFTQCPGGGTCMFAADYVPVCVP